MNDQVTVKNDSTADQTGLATPRKSRIAARVAAIAVTLAVGGASLVGTAPSADAWAWDPNVTLRGRAIACSSAATWVWVEGSNGERGWATQPGGNYSFRFTRVPTSGMTVKVNFGNRLCSKSTSFGLNRPTVGTSATRNVITIY